MAEFVMMIAPPGAGKTTYAWAKYSKDHLIVTSDRIRQKLFNSETDQSDNRKVFKEMNRIAIGSLYHGKSVVYDATNTRKDQRERLLKGLPEGTSKVAIVMRTPLDICIERNNLRARKVPEDKIRKYYAQLQECPPNLKEGWDKIIVVTGTDEAGNEII